MAARLPHPERRSAMPDESGAINLRLLLTVVLVAVLATGAGFLVGLWIGG